MFTFIFNLQNLVIQDSLHFIFIMTLLVIILLKWLNFCMTLVQELRFPPSRNSQYSPAFIAFFMGIFFFRIKEKICPRLIGANMWSKKMLIFQSNGLPSFRIITPRKKLAVRISSFHGKNDSSRNFKYFFFFTCVQRILSYLTRKVT